MPRDRITQLHQNYGFVEFMGEDDADYAIKIMNMIKIYGKPIRVNKVRKWLLSCVTVVFESYFVSISPGRVKHEESRRWSKRVHW